ncbi:helix-turn-helix domain-containing protein [Streptomyces buecherae]|uniref:Helix-turn-helix transcriptional regulator n=1 Tax=Streptomyces buecherae TaxID=2763006 RepID=A0A7H8N7F3_9ACTN|nr:helix-turn-helix transcriptional regulator [Streptomyces buecherae]QKW50236.1 helix-turn-helix transcriptional regulator [Streptomyces buecherae]
MSSTTADTPPTPGENIAVLRKARGIGQAKLAKRCGFSVSYLSKVETGLRPATPQFVAAVAAAMRITTARVYGQPFADTSQQAEGLDVLRAAVRRHTLPREDALPPAALLSAVREAVDLRARTRYLDLLALLPRLLGQATASAFEAPGDATVWAQVADLYGCAYGVAHRLGQADLADMIVSRQMWAARQTWAPDVEASAAWNEAGTYQTAGQYDDGLTVIERAISAYERATHALGTTPERLVSLGSLHLRGVVLASRHRDAAATEAHVTRAKALAEQLPRDVLAHNLTFGPGNVALYELAARIELDKPADAARMATPLLTSPPAGLRPTRVGRLAIDAARAHLAVRGYEEAERALGQAFAVAPEMAAVHPMSREVIRVLFVLNQRTRPRLLEMARRVGLAT